jgi:2-isopropylmalate synthase
MTPESIGLARNTLVLGKHSGRHAFDLRLTEMGFALSEEERSRAFERFKELADRKKPSRRWTSKRCSATPS